MLPSVIFQTDDDNCKNNKRKNTQKLKDETKHEENYKKLKQSFFLSLHFSSSEIQKTPNSARAVATKPPYKQSKKKKI